MSNIIFFPGSGGSVSNPSQTYESVGWINASQTGQAITASATANQKGNYSQLVGAGASGVTVNNWSGFWLRMYLASDASRFLLDLSIDGGSNIKVADLFASPASSSAPKITRVFIPLQVSAGSDIRMRCQSSSSGSDVIITDITGLISSASDYPGYTTATQLQTVDATNTRPGASGVTVPLTTSATSWTELISSTGATYGAVLVQQTAVATVTNTQITRTRIGTGTAGNEVEKMWLDSMISSVNPANPNAIDSFLQTVASGTRLTANVQGATVTAETFSIGLIGFS